MSSTTLYFVSAILGLVLLYWTIVKGQKPAWKGK